MYQTVIAAGIDPDERPDLSEIVSLAEATGATVVEEFAQQNHPDPGSVFGKGTIETITTSIDNNNVDAVIVDQPLTPSQTVTLEDSFGVPVSDRHRLVLEIFASRARTRRAKRQVELAQLKYELPRIKAVGDPSHLNIALETGTKYHDVLDRITQLQQEIDSLPPVAASVIERRRSAGFDLVPIVGYTNAGKSTLLRQLADEMSIEGHGNTDLTETAAIEDRLFKTLETTTRRATIDGRKILLTDTVGFLDDLPHWLVSSFRGSLEVTSEADAIILLADIDQPEDELRRKIKTSLRTLKEPTAPIIPVLNKCDRIQSEFIEPRYTCVAELVSDPLLISAETGEGIDDLTHELLMTLPPLDETSFEIPMNDDSMSFLSWLYDEAVGVDVAYGVDTIRVEVQAKPPTISKAQSRCESITT